MITSKADLEEGEPMGIALAVLLVLAVCVIGIGAATDIKPIAITSPEKTP